EVEFFGERSELTARRLNVLRSNVDEARARLPEHPDAWYLKKNDPYRLASLRSQYLRAMALARPAEKTALGYAYSLSFGAASEALHFAVLDSSNQSKSESAPSEALSGLLAVAIIC